MINQEFLSNCSDEQINKGVAWLEASKYGFKQPCEIMIYDGFAFTDISKFAFSPCANPNDAWPIMMENLISTTPRGSESFAQPYASSGMLAVMSHCESNSELLRAAMEVYILMSVES